MRSEQNGPGEIGEMYF